MAGAISMSEWLSNDSIQIAIVGRNDNTESNFRMLMDYPAKAVSGDSGPLYYTRPCCNRAVSCSVWKSCMLRSIPAGFIV